jgi:hypothetical protein
MFLSLPKKSERIRAERSTYAAKSKHAVPFRFSPAIPPETRRRPPAVSIRRGLAKMYKPLGIIAVLLATTFLVGGVALRAPIHR